GVPTTPLDVTVTPTTRSAPSVQTTSQTPPPTAIPTLEFHQQLPSRMGVESSTPLRVNRRAITGYSPGDACSIHTARKSVPLAAATGCCCAANALTDRSNPAALTDVAAMVKSSESVGTLRMRVWYYSIRCQSSCDVSTRCSGKGVAHPGDFGESERPRTDRRRRPRWSSTRMLD